MATLILSAVGAAAGGPIGGAIGALIGQQIDGLIFAPKARQGPRLGDLAVQTSSYGTQIPKIFGKMRVAGSVIWATDFKEDRTRTGGGKGRAKTDSYSYSASFAIALSGRPIRVVGRIWADGKLLRGAAGDFKTQTGFRLYSGTEEQLVDPLIASAEGIGGAPAHRGVAYAVFQDFQLGDYGNRIPSLTFEVEAEPEPVAIGAMAAELSAGEILAAQTPALSGFAATGDSVRAALESLSDVAPLSLTEEGGRLRLGSGATGPLIIERAETEARSEANAAGRSEFARRAVTSIPGEVSLAYHDVERDYQAGLQRATRGGASAKVQRIALPAALSAQEAKAFAEQRLVRLWAERETAKISLRWRRIAIKPGAEVRIEGELGVWRVARWTLHRMIATVELVRVGAGPIPDAAGATPGRPAKEADRLHGPTTLFLFEAALPGEELSNSRLYAAAAGAEGGWRRAALTASFDGGSTWQAAGAVTAATMGRALTALPAAGSALLDQRHRVDIELLNDEMWLEGRGDQALVAGANLALIGDELIQFGHAEPLGARRFRLSRLLRGRRGSEAAAAAHRAGESFVLLEREKLVAIEVPPGMVGAEATLLAQGIGDGDEGVLTRKSVTGAAMLPPSPVHFAAKRRAGGDLAFSWARRSRTGWSWLSGSDTALAEERELYRLVLAGGAFRRVIEVTSPGFLYTAAEQAEDGAPANFAAELRQIGNQGPSLPAELRVI